MLTLRHTIMKFQNTRDDSKKKKKTSKISQKEKIFYIQKIMNEKQKNRPLSIHTRS